MGRARSSSGPISSSRCTSIGVAPSTSRRTITSRRAGGIAAMAWRLFQGARAGDAKGVPGGGRVGPVARPFRIVCGDEPIDREYWLPSCAGAGTTGARPPQPERGLGKHDDNQQRGHRCDHRSQPADHAGALADHSEHQRERNERQPGERPTPDATPARIDDGTASCSRRNTGCSPRPPATSAHLHAHHHQRLLAQGQDDAAAGDRDRQRPHCPRPRDPGLRLEDRPSAEVSPAQCGPYRKTGTASATSQRGRTPACPASGRTRPRSAPPRPGAGPEPGSSGRCWPAAGEATPRLRAAAWLCPEQ